MSQTKRNGWWLLWTHRAAVSRNLILDIPHPHRPPNWSFYSLPDLIPAHCPPSPWKSIPIPASVNSSQGTISSTVFIFLLDHTSWPFSHWSRKANSAVKCKTEFLPSPKKAIPNHHNDPQTLWPKGHKWRRFRFSRTKLQLKNQHSKAKLLLKLWSLDTNQPRE